MSLLEEALTYAGNGNYSFAAAKISEAGYTDVATQVQQAGIMGAPPADVQRIARNLLARKGATLAARQGPTVSTQPTDLPTASGGVAGDSPINPRPQGPAASGGLGGLLGGAIGSLIPGLGTAAGAGLGSAIGGLFGGGSGDNGGGGLSNTPIIPGGVLTPGIGPTFGQVGAAAQNLFGFGPQQGAQLPMPAGSFSTMTAPQAGVQLKAGKDQVIVSIKPGDVAYNAAKGAGGVLMPDGSVKVSMDKAYAKSKGYWKARPKPPITAYQAKRIRKARTDLARAKKAVRSLTTTRKSCR